MKIIPALTLLATFAAAGCSNGEAGRTLADMPKAIGGLSEGVPPRPGTAEYDKWQKQRAIDAATPKAAKR